jgi:hypothetical protein
MSRLDTRLADLAIEAARTILNANPNPDDLEAVRLLSDISSKARKWERADLWKLGPIGRHLWIQEAGW